MADIFDNLVYTENDIIKFPTGIPGFEKNTDFVIVQIPEYTPFEWLICIDGSRLRFVVINPLLFMPDYEPAIVKEQLEGLEIRKPEDILLYTIVTIREDARESTANLVGPIIINKNKKIGKQIILDDEKYTTREKILRD
ncbi:MAG: flagellar assembly protein FliW [Chitinivibrionales bacterium]|nr:flagellar assembly protein FliW [Chitinivibrionales bacterium]